eukprot:4439030-Amphidinium_carterae.2
MTDILLQSEQKKQWSGMLMCNSYTRPFPQTQEVFKLLNMRGSWRTLIVVILMMPSTKMMSLMFHPKLCSGFRVRGVEVNILS